MSKLLYSKEGHFLNVRIGAHGGSGNSAKSSVTFDTARNSGGQSMSLLITGSEGEEEIFEGVEAVDVVLYGTAEFSDMCGAVSGFAHTMLDRYKQRALQFDWAFVDDLYSDGPFKVELDRFMAMAALALNQSQDGMNLYSIELDAGGSRFMLIRHLGISPVVQRKLSMCAELIGWEAEFEEKD